MIQWLAALAFALLPLLGHSQVETQHVLPYGAHVAQRLTLWLPDKSAKPAPVLIFVPGGFWGALDERFQRMIDINAGLRSKGAAVALLRTRTGREAPWPSPVQDVALATALLKREAKKYHINPKGLYLIGHSSGAFAVTALTLNAELLRQAGLSGDDIAGVIALSGIYDLAGAAHHGRVAEYIDAAFNTTPEKLNATAPGKTPFLMLSGEGDLDGFVRDAQSFARQLRRAGRSVIYQTVPGANHQATANLVAEENRLVREMVLDFIGIVAKPEELELLVDANQHLLFRPPMAGTSFWDKYAAIIRSYPVDDAFRNFLGAQILDHRYQLAGLPLKTFYAIPVADLVKSLPGSGRFLVTTNARQERYHWHIEELLRSDTLIVVGIDDEKNLFRFGVPYRTLREHSWEELKQPMASAYRALGGMIYFRKRPPAQFLLGFSASMSLTPESFALSEKEPLDAFADLPAALKPVMTHVNGCLSCHTLRGVGTLAHHVRIADGAKQGGFALPLEAYPDEVWKRFVFEQAKVAKMVGVTANLVAEPARAPLFEYVNKIRAGATR